jgi:hypothetical protein
MQGYGIAKGRGAGSRFVKSGSAFGGVTVLMRAYAAALGKAGEMAAKRKLILGRKKASDEEIAGWFRRFGISAAELALKD